MLRPGAAYNILCATAQRFTFLCSSFLYCSFLYSSLYILHFYILRFYILRTTFLCCGAAPHVLIFLNQVPPMEKLTAFVSNK